jgi:uncharacterized protein (TIGR03118 family)
MEDRLMRCFLSAAALVALMVLPSALPQSRADTVYNQTDLVSDIAGMAQITDPNLINPWGLSFSASSPFWVSNQGTNTSTLYTVKSGTATQNALVVTIPQAATPPVGPTGQVNNNTTDFQVNGAAANFIFASLDGSISAWNNSAGTTAQVKVGPTTGTSYTGLAIGTSASGNFLYAANNTAGKIDVFNGSFAAANLGANAFANPAGLPSGLVPFNVQNIGGKIYVSYAPAGHAAQTAAQEGTGAVAAFDTSGNFIQGSLIAGSKLASPWGITLAPAGFGQFGGDLLVGNFAYGFSEINAFDPVTGALLGTLSDANGNKLLNQGLWALDFGNGGNGGDPNTLYFTAGINGERDGLIGAIAAAAPIAEPSTIALLLTGGLFLHAVRCWRRRKAFVVNR